MRVVLKVASGVYEGRSVLLHPGQVVKVGRTEWADFAVPHDNRMSGVHFSLECDLHTCRLRDLDSTNGTLVNDEKTVETEVKDGDRINAGRTTFTVQVEQTAATVTNEPEIDRPAGQESLEAAVAVTVSDVPSMASPALLSAAATGKPYDEALSDEDPLVRREAMLAAVWTSQPWLLEHCRWVAAKPAMEDWGALWLLAVLGQPSDLERILTIGRTEALGSKRFQIYASYGHPRVVKDLLIGIGGEDPNTAVAAGTAFTKITGADIDSQERVQLPPEDGSEPDEFEKEFLDEAFLPSLKLAEEHWREVKDHFAEGVRWRRGIDLTRGSPVELLAGVDMEGRWEACLRGKYERTWQGTPQDLERFRAGYTGRAGAG